MKFLLANTVVLTLVLTGCVEQPVKPVGMSPALTQAIGDAVARYAASVYPAAGTHLHLYPPTDESVTQVVITSLSHQGFGLSDAPEAEGIPFGVIVEQRESRALVRVTTPERSSSCLVDEAKPCTWTVRIAP